MSQEEGALDLMCLGGMNSSIVLTSSAESPVEMLVKVARAAAVLGRKKVWLGVKDALLTNATRPAAPTVRNCRKTSVPR